MQILIHLIFWLAFLSSTLAFVKFLSKKQSRKYLALVLVLCLSLMVGACSDVSRFMLNQTPAGQDETSDLASVGQSSTTDTRAEPTPIPTRTPTQKTSNLSDDTLTVHFLDVGQGASTLVQLGNKTMLIDGGGPEKSSFVVAYLLETEITSVDVVVATHYDEDHINGLVGVLTKFDIGAVFDCPYPTDTRASKSFKRIIEEKSIDETVPTPGDSFSFGDAEVTFLAPQAYGHDDSNDDSIALMLEYNQIRFLITGDSSADAEQKLLEQDLKCDVLLAMHHGSNVSNSKSFLSATAPDFVVISCGQENTYEHPGDETLSRIQNTGAHLFRTDKQGTIICTTDGQSLSWSAKPCDDFTPGMRDSEPTETSMDKSTTATTEPDGTDETDETDQKYVLNLNTKKFHYPDCRSVDQMAEKNKEVVEISRDEIIDRGYVPCKNCDP